MEIKVDEISELLRKQITDFEKKVDVSEVGKNYEERLKASLKKMIEKDVDIEYVLDPSLLGGVLVKVGSTMYDSSVKGQLRLLKDELIKG